jgi:hypothetical protein
MILQLENKQLLSSCGFKVVGLNSCHPAFLLLFPAQKLGKRKMAQQAYFFPGFYTIDPWAWSYQQKYTKN